MSKVVEGLYYASSHEWLKIEGNIGIVGITDYAQSSLGTIVFVDLPEAGTAVKAGTEFGAVESVKAASDLICPVSGKVLEANPEAADDPEAINRDAFGTWLIKVELANPSEAKALLTAEQYRPLSK
ncbi:MAG TPA: glycine cleavage system protein GcvH [Candidatus Izemoplasmatales bacterium]|nr:glycine cleavage system protein GcvH [Bacillota bacterium]HRY78006.1 glycine cleavage system protein GcvH [Candidatus Izemoplasmatales bacterium]